MLSVRALSVLLWGGVYYARVNTTAMHPPQVGLLGFIVG
jgi:hypothetical protein